MTFFVRNVQPAALKLEIQRQVKFDKTLHKDLRMYTFHIIGEANSCEKYALKKMKQIAGTDGRKLIEANETFQSPKGGSHNCGADKGGDKVALCLCLQHKERRLREKLRE